MRALLAALLLASVCSLVLAASCTTNETGSIDLVAPSAEKPPKLPMMMPKPDMMMVCKGDAGAGCPKQPMSPPTMPKPDMMTGCEGEEDAACPKEPTPPPKAPPP
jgi:hypothetical protein